MTGVTILRQVARTLFEGVREAYEVSRIGGELFAVLLPDTDAGLAIEMTGRLRAVLAAKVWPLRAVTASQGVATTAKGAGASVASLTDQALYDCKCNGRDRVAHCLVTSRIEPTPEAADCH